jgi:putative phosphoribosyl transferase
MAAVHPLPFRDRSEAGRVLALHLTAYEHQPDTVVVALPRGGVPVAYEVAQALHAPLDIFLVRKLGVSGTKSSRWARSPRAASVY